MSSPKESKESQQVAAKMKSMFDSTDLRDAITERMSNEDFRERVIDAWRGWGEKEVASRLAPCREELGSTFGKQQPFAQSLVFTTYDWPASSADLITWLAAVLHAGGDGGAEPSAAAKAVKLPECATKAAVAEAIKAKFPRMHDNPQTEEFMAGMILPFRGVVQAQAVAFAIDEAARDIGSDPAAVRAASAAAAASGSGVTAEAKADKGRSETAKLPPRELTAAERHAMSHVSGGEDVLRRVDRMRDECDAAGLRQLRSAALRRGQVTRYVDYQLIFLDADADEITDADFVERLRPLADAGLAFAQHDVGALLLKLAAAQHKLLSSQPATPVSAGSTKKGTPPPMAGSPGPSPPVTSGADATERSCPLDTAVRWVQRSISRGGATMSPLEVEGVNYLERAMSLGHTEARVALGAWHVARASCIVEHGMAGAKELMALKAPAKRQTGGKSGSPSPQGESRRASGAGTPRNGPTPSVTPSGSLGGEQVTAWTVSCKYHLKAALRAAEDVAEGLAPVWDRAEHAEHLEGAKAVMADVAGVRQLLKMAAKRAAGGSELDVLNPWMREALGANRDSSWLFRATRLFLLAAGLGAVYMVYVLWTAPPSQCRAGFADSDRIAAAKKSAWQEEHRQQARLVMYRTRNPQTSPEA